MSFKSYLINLKFAFISCILFMLIQTSPAKPILFKYDCECKVKMDLYLKDFNLNSTAEMQAFIGISEPTGKLNKETCAFLNRRWSSKIIHWRFVQTSFFTDKISLTADSVSKVLKNAAIHWSNITNLKLVEVDSEQAEIQFSFVDKTSQTCNNRSNGERILKDFNETFGCAHLPGYENAGHVLFYAEKWLVEEDDMQNHEHGHNLLAAAVHAFGYALGMNSSVYEDVFHEKKLRETVRNEEIDRFAEQKLYNFSPTRD